MKGQYSLKIYPIFPSTCIGIQVNADLRDAAHSLDEIGGELRPNQLDSELQQRKRNLGESWNATRNGLFSYSMVKNCIPDVKRKCDWCNDDEALIKCLACSACICRDCGDRVHSQNGFHEREVWIRGYFEHIGNRQTVSGGQIVLTGTERNMTTFIL